MNGEPVPDLETDRTARAALSRLAEPGDLRLARMVHDLGAPVVLRNLASNVGSDGLASDVALRVAAIDPVVDLARAARLGIRFVVPGDAEWPTSLDALHGADPVHGRGGTPLGLWVRGPLSLADTVERAVSIVGSRNATTYGEQIALEIGTDVGRAGWSVVSGAAIGIDQAGHRGALSAHAPTVAVLACGVDRAYPVKHTELLEVIGRTGLVVSELAPGCAPTRGRFLIRNRVIAALAGGTVVVEAAIRSGSLSTASWAMRLNRPVLGVPGPVTSETSGGVHEMVRSGAALLVTSGAEVLDVVSPVGEHLLAPRRGEVRPHDRLSRVDQQVLDAVPAVRPSSADSVARTAGLAPAVVGPSLDRLTRAGLVERSEGGHRLCRELAS